MLRLLKTTPVRSGTNPAGFDRTPSPQAWNKVANSFLTGMSSQMRSAEGIREKRSVNRRSPSCSKRPETEYPSADTAYSAVVAERVREVTPPVPPGNAQTRPSHSA